MRVLKFPLAVESVQYIKLHDAAQILSVQVQDDAICLWALCPDMESTHERRIQIFGTGHDMPADTGLFVGTVQQRGYVWHVFASARR